MNTIITDVAHFLARDEAAWDGTERRGPDRATNVSRIAPTRPVAKAPARPAAKAPPPAKAPQAARPAAPAPRMSQAATGTDGADGDWEQF